MRSQRWRTRVHIGASLHMVAMLVLATGLALPNWISFDSKPSLALWDASPRTDAVATELLVCRILYVLGFCSGLAVISWTILSAKSVPERLSPEDEENYSELLDQFYAQATAGRGHSRWATPCHALGLGTLVGACKLIGHRIST